MIKQDIDKNNCKISMRKQKKKKQILDRKR